MNEEQIKVHANAFYYQQALGPNAERYLALFEKFEQAGERWVAGWNWAAFFCSSAWFAYRRMNGYSMLNFFLPVAVIFLLLVVRDGGLQLLIGAAYLGIAFGVIPMYADAIYYRDLKYRIACVEASEDSEKTSGLLRPPSAGSAANATLTAALILGLPLLILIAIPSYSDYVPRAKVVDALALTHPLKTSISEFHANNKRLPTSQEAEKFRADGGKYAEALVYDVDKRMIVVTMREGSYKNKRFALTAEEKDGALVWTCRTIDLEAKYLPSSCR